MNLFLPNFDFEHELSAIGHYAVPDRLRRLNSELAAAFALVAEDGDLIWLPEPIDGDFTTHLASHGLPSIQFVSREAEVPPEATVVPWGWTTRLIHWCDTQGWRVDAPEIDVIRSINSRRFSFELEAELGTGLEEACEIQSLESLEAAVAEFSKDHHRRWVVKAEFGMSGRERILGQRESLDDQQRQWAKRRLQANGVLFFEPWVDRIEEAGLQLHIPRDGEPDLLGITILLSDATGQYRGSRVANQDSLLNEWSASIAAATMVAKRAQQMGYFGPLGIDAMRYRDEAGREQVRPLQDINGRWTMGRISLGLRRVLQPSESASWLHIRQPKDRGLNVIDRFSTMLPPNVRSMRISPQEVGRRVVDHATVALFATDADSLMRAETTVTQHG